MLVVLGQHPHRAGLQAHALAVQHAVRHVIAVGAQIVLAEAFVGMAQPLGQVDLADVVHQCADSQVEHLVVAEAEHAAHQQRDDGHVHRMRAGVVAGIAGQQPDAHVAVDQHLVEQRTRQVLGVAPRLLGPREHAVLRGAPGMAGFVELLLAQLGRGALRTELLAALALGGLGGGLGRQLDGRASGDGGVVDGGKGRWRRQFALVRAPAQLLQPQAADLVDLLRVGDAEAADGKGMLHPLQVEMDEHAYAQLVYVDLARHRQGPRGFGVRCWTGPLLAFRQPDTGT